MPSDYSQVFEALPSAASLWIWTESSNSLALLLGNQTFRILFRRRSQHVHSNESLENVVSPTCASQVLGHVSTAMHQKKTIQVPLDVPALRVTQARLIPLSGNHLAIFWKGDIEDSPPSTPVHTSTSPVHTHATSLAFTPIHPTPTSTSTSTSAPITPLSQTLSTPINNNHSARSIKDILPSPLKSIKLDRKLESPSTSIKAAKKHFDIIENGASLENPMRDLGEVLPNLVAEQNSDAVKHALAHGADPDGHGGSFTPLYAAIKLGRVALCELLLSEGAAVARTNEDTLQSPIQLGINLDPESPIYELLLEHIRYGELLVREESQVHSFSNDTDPFIRKRARTTDSDHVDT